MCLCVCVNENVIGGFLYLLLFNLCVCACLFVCVFAWLCGLLLLVSFTLTLLTVNDVAVVAVGQVVFAVFWACFFTRFFILLPVLFIES